MRIIVTGARSGIGNFIAKSLSKKNEVVGISRNKIKSAKFKSYQCDLTNIKQIKNLKDSVFQNKKTFDALICSAGTQGKFSTFDNLSSNQWIESVSSNIKMTFYPIKEFRKNYNIKNRFKIICFSGGGATAPRVNLSGYSAGKTAIVRMVENLSLEWNQENIDINVIAPGAIYTNMTKELLALGKIKIGENEYATALDAKINSKKRLNNVYKLIAFLLSKKSNGISGNLISAQWDSLLDIKSNLAMNNECYKLRRLIK
tara:strand:+ start:240 stop:1013 length:774 start_codon:yes stop_codon:yes gene_type:complete